MIGMLKFGKERIAHANIGLRIPLIGFCRLKLRKRFVGEDKTHALLRGQQFRLQFCEGYAHLVRIGAVIGQSIAQLGALLLGSQ